ncbi:glycosyltransferase family 4 protein [Agromyces aurantiacus]|uniref:Glycosyltransferase family 4 protein n=1 Tax=Agromyces aurantiacus TaxID=165814 RepID=A0ABV9R5Q7_9MICO|nr:glycosyltransferase family 4 protein [Agromyces aurantiacus]MBM7504156.1 glycosyltransferase involved in cell wall biosynthesis [Agromyces aurantiacus]
MRILIVTPWFPTADASASGRFVAREAAALGEEHEVTVLHLDWQRARADATHEGPFALTRVPLSRARPGDYRRARATVAEASRSADVVHTHSLTGLIPWRGKRPANRPWVHSEHWSGLTAPETLRPAERVMRRMLLGTLDLPDVVVAESRRLARAVQANRSGPTMIVPCIVGESPVTEPPRGDVLELVGVGGIIPRKGPLLAVRALAYLVEAGCETRLTWVGEGPQRDEVLAEASALGVADRLNLTGVLDDAGVGAALDAADVFVLPTQGDNFCVVAAEALSHGRPIVSGAETGAVDYAAPSVSVFVHEQTGRAYADAVLAVRESVRGLDARDIAATVAGRFTPAAVRAGLEAAYGVAGADVR